MGKKEQRSEKRKNGKSVRGKKRGKRVSSRISLTGIWPHSLTYNEKEGRSASSVDDNRKQPGGKRHEKNLSGERSGSG